MGGEGLYEIGRPTQDVSENPFSVFRGPLSVDPRELEERRSSYSIALRRKDNLPKLLSFLESSQHLDAVLERLNAVDHRSNIMLPEELNRV